MKDKEITIIDDNGKEKVLNILFTFEKDDDKYVLCFDDKDKDTILPFKYDDEGNIFVVEDEDELDMISECLDDYDKRRKNNEKDY